MVESTLSKMFEHPNFDTLFHRMWKFNFITKVIALALNTLCVYVWVTGLDETNLPVNNQHQLSLFYHTVPAFNIVLIVMVLMYLVGEIPTRAAQEVFQVTGFTLYLIVGTIGVKNSIDNDYPSMMLVMSIMCVAVACALVFDFNKTEDFFKPHHADNIID